MTSPDPSHVQQLARDWLVLFSTLSTDGTVSKVYEDFCQNPFLWNNWFQQVMVIAGVTQVLYDKIQKIGLVWGLLVIQCRELITPCIAAPLISTKKQSWNCLLGLEPWLMLYFSETGSWIQICPYLCLRLNANLHFCLASQAQFGEFCE